MSTGPPAVAFRLHLCECFVRMGIISIQRVRCNQLVGGTGLVIYYTLIMFKTVSRISYLHQYINVGRTHMYRLTNIA